MTEYTSLEVSRRLAEVGFKEDYDGMCWIHGDKATFLGYYTADFAEDVIANAYRADTLLAWLLERGFIDGIISYPDETKVEYTAKGIWKDIDGFAPTLRDALAEVVLKVMKVGL